MFYDYFLPASKKFFKAGIVSNFLWFNRTLKYVSRSIYLLFKKFISLFPKSFFFGNGGKEPYTNIITYILF